VSHISSISASINAFSAKDVPFGGLMMTDQGCGATQNSPKLKILGLE